ncbi:MFS transporter [Subtercola boreus]|uniref:MFS transporter n=1 Tax=Subtercola boreus TaxID=120213 RepID=UPI0011C08338|nr:MFS transporter [Subtercola boreus]
MSRLAVGVAEAAIITCCTTLLGDARSTSQRASLPPILWARIAGPCIVVIWVAGSSFALVLVGAIVASTGTGILLPTMLTWAVAGLSFEERGRGTGLWQSAFFLGQFLSPLAVLALTGIAGALQPALGALGIASPVIAAVIFASLRNRSMSEFLKEASRSLPAARSPQQRSTPT